MDLVGVAAVCRCRAGAIAKSGSTSDRGAR